MKRYFILSVLLIAGNTLYCQVKSVSESLNLKPQLFIISADNKKIETNDLAVTKAISDESSTAYLQPQWIDSISILTNKDTIDKYGSLGQNGVVLIDLIPGTLALLPIELKKQFK